MSFFGRGLGLPVIQRTVRPMIAGTPVWYAEASAARTTLDIPITIPSGDARKLVVLWGTNADPGTVNAAFEPLGVNFQLLEIGSAAGQNGQLRCRAFYLDTPTTGAKVVRISTSNAVRSAVSLKVFQDARAGDVPAEAEASSSAQISVFMSTDESLLIDAYSETCDLVLATGLADGDLTPFDGQTGGADDVINAAFLARTSQRTHAHSGDVTHGYTAASAAEMLMVAVNIPFSAGQVEIGTATELFRWDLNEINSPFADAYGLTNASVQAGTASGGHAPLFSGGGTSISMQGAMISAAHHAAALVRSWSAEIYLQPRSHPSSGNRAIVGKDTGLPAKGGFQVEQEPNDAIDFYIRDATGLAGTAIHVTSTSGDGTLTLNQAHVIHLTYDDTTKTAAIYLDRVLLATKTTTVDPKFAGLEENTSPFSMFSRDLESGVEFDGIGDRVTFFSGVLTAAEIAARPAPTTITDPLAPGAITAVDETLKTVVQNNNDIDVLANDTGKTGPHYRLEITADAVTPRLSVINQDSATAKIRITMPAPATGDRNESGRYRVREGTSPTFGNPSNEATLPWRQVGTGSGGDYEPFDFVTVSNPSVSHSGVANRPGYSATDPRSASVIDPMSGIQLFRIGGNENSTIFINGTQNSGKLFPRCLRNDNNSKGFKVWNSDSSLLMIDRRFDRGTITSSHAGSYLIDVTGTRGASAPWRIIRVDPLNDFAGVSGLKTDWWFWDPLNPLRVYLIYSDGRLAEWWPIGGSGHSQGERNILYGGVDLPSGYSNANSGGGRPSSCTPTSDGQYRILTCQRNSDGRWGGFRQNLLTGAIQNQFVVSPDFDFSEGPTGIQDNNRDAKGISELGNYTSFSPDGTRQTFKSLTSGSVVSETHPNHNVFSHNCHLLRNGIEYFCGVSTDSINLWHISAGVREIKTTEAGFQGANPNHLGSLNWNDTFEVYGGNGSGATSGVRYLLYSRAGPRNGHPRAIMGVRCGPNDTNRFRFICNHRSVRTDNSDEAHCQMDPDARYVVFPSNWQEPGGADSQIHPYIAVLPDGWKSPNNDGS